MAAPDDSTCQRYEKWLRVVTLVHFGCKKICFDLLHIEERLPTDGEELYIYLAFHKQSINPQHFQEHVLFPPDKITTDESKFDVALYTRIIQGLFGTKYNMLLDDLRKLRNKEFHRGNIQLTKEEFIELWRETSSILESHGFDMDLVDGLKDCEFSQLHKYSEPLLDVIQDCIQGISEPFTFLSYMLCIFG